MAPFFSKPYLHGEKLPLSSIHSGWLLACLRLSASKIGCESWWSLGDIAKAIELHTRLEHSRSDTTLDEFEQSVKIALGQIGYPELASAFSLAHPVQRCSLLSLACDPPLQDEHDFFSRLEAKILCLNLQGVQQLHLMDLTHCEAGGPSVDAAFQWFRLNLNRAKIVSAIRKQIRILPWPQPLRCLIS